MPKYSEIQEVKIGPGKVNDLLKEGWELLHVVPLPHAVVYVLGKREEENKPEKPAYKK